MANAASYPSWKVEKELDHGGLIHGRRRKVGDVFEAPASAMTFLETEGIVSRAPVAPAEPVGKKGKAAAEDKAAA